MSDDLRAYVCDDWPLKRRAAHGRLQSEEVDRNLSEGTPRTGACEDAGASETHSEILGRVEILKTVPGLREQEDRAIDAALNAFRFLEREEDRYDENQRSTARFSTPPHGSWNFRAEDQQAGRVLFGVGLTADSSPLGRLELRCPDHERSAWNKCVSVCNV